MILRKHIDKILIVAENRVSSEIVSSQPPVENTMATAKLKRKQLLLGLLQSHRASPVS